MKFLSRVVWSEGMHLGPHHFQTQSRYFEDTLWFLNSNMRQDPWGFLHYSIDTEALRNGLAILSFASGILPDGLIFDLPDCDPPPVPAQLADLFSSTDSEITLCLAIPPRQDQGLDCDLTGTAVSTSPATRYTSVQRSLRDDSIGLGENSVAFARKNLALLSKTQLTPSTISFPIARILRDGNGGFTTDPEFIPPCLRISASERLVLLLHHLAQAIEEKINTTRSQRASSGRFELGTSALDVANYWFLHALCSALPALRHHLQDRRSHPEDVYRDLVRLAGALSTFALDSSRDQVPAYSHTDLTTTFRDLDALIRRYLDIVCPPNTVTLEFQRVDNYSFAAEVKDERCLRRSRWIFGIRSNLADSILLRQTPTLAKVCSGRGISTLIKRALPGLELLHLPVPPAALHAQADMHYFSIAQNGPCWQDILSTRRVGVYLPGDLGNATFDVTIITETTS